MEYKGIEEMIDLNLLNKTINGDIIATGLFDDSPQGYKWHDRLLASGWNTRAMNAREIAKQHNQPGFGFGLGQLRDSTEVN